MSSIVIDTTLGPYLPGYAPHGPTRPGSGTDAPRSQRTNPTREYVAAGPAYGNRRMPVLLDAAVDEIVKAHGPRTYLAMNRDPACRAAAMALKLGVVAGGMDLAPAEAPDAGVKEFDPDQKTSADLVDYVWRQVERCPDFESTVFDLLESCVLGVRLAEFTLELEADGPDAGKLGLKSLRTKANDRWGFRVDEYLAVTGIEVKDPTGERAVYPPDKFVWLTWDPTDGDPRGTSVYAAAHEAWALKIRAWPEFFAYLCQFGSPSLIGETGPIVEQRPPLNADGTEDFTSPTVNAQVRMAQEMEFFRNESVFTHANGGKVYTIAPSGNGEAFHKAIDLYDRQITHAILGTTSATMEAEHDSRAKGETGQDVVSLKIERGRKALAEALRGLFRRIITLNFGPDAARLTPLVTFGQTEAQNRAELWGAAAGLGLKLGDSQISELCQMIGLPQPDMQADEAAAAKRAEQAMEQQRAMTPAAGQDKDEGGEGKPPGPPQAGHPLGGKPAPAKPKPAAGEAKFALDAPLPGPWHDADWIAAQALVRQAFPSAAALKRWEAGTESLDNRRVILEEIADRAKARLTAEGQALAAELRGRRTAPVAQFASVFETVSRWRAGVAKSLRQFYLAGTLALLGPADLAPDEWEALRGQTETQLEYLDGFATRLMDPNNPLDGTVGSNAGMYGQSIKAVASAMERQRAIKAGMTAERRIHVGDPSEMCSECKAEQRKGWQPIGTLKPIGACLCKTGCHCHFEYKS